MARKTHIFDNGVSVYDEYLMPAQRQRYKIRNVHEADEEAFFIKIIASLAADAVFVNIGTAIGYYVILAKKLSPQLKIHAVEPLASFRHALSENLKLNEMSDGDLILHPVAVGATDGRASFLEKGYESQLLDRSESTGVFQNSAVQIKSQIKAMLGALGVKRYAAGAGIKSETDVVCLESLMGRVGEPVDLMTMDVQGLEIDILTGGAAVLESGNIKSFIIGTHGKKVHQQCLSILRSKGYDIEHDEQATKHQPDGIIVASLGLSRLSSYSK